jgi:hypothetical protein
MALTTERLKVGLVEWVASQSDLSYVVNLRRRLDFAFLA